MPLPTRTLCLCTVLLLAAGCGSEPPPSSQGVQPEGPKPEGNRATRQLSDFGKGQTEPHQIAENVYQAHAVGNTLHALHLTDMALAAEPGHRGALETRLGSLELLMERSGDENHSEVLWLTHEIGAAREALGS